VNLALGLGMPAGSGVPFTPLIFSPVGFWLSAPSGLRLDEDGTGAVVADAAVGWRQDLAGSLHLLQETAGSRPLYKTNGGKHWLEYDGSDDWMRVAFARSQPWSRISAIRQLSWADGDRIFGPAAGSGAGYLFHTTSSPRFSLYDGSGAAENADAAIDADAVVIEVHAGASSKIIVNNGTPTTGDPGATATDGMTTAGDNGAPSSVGNFRDYGIAVFAGDITTSLTVAQLAQLTAYFSALCESPPL
jgi:hypothetical protein